MSEKLPLHAFQLLRQIVTDFQKNHHEPQQFSKNKKLSYRPERPRDASCQLKSCQLRRNSAETTYTTSPDQIDGMKLEI